MTPADVIPLALSYLSPTADVLCMNADAADAIGDLAPDITVHVGEPDMMGDHLVDACLLFDGAVATRGVSGPVLLADAIAQTRPGGLILVLVPSRRYHQAQGEDVGLLAEDLDHALRERGLDVLALYAPGVGARLAGRAYHGAPDREVDRTPGLLDAGEWILGVAQTWQTSEERSDNFFASLPKRLAAASAICLHPTSGELLCVFDNFKQQWTLPGGVVDKHESPQEGAVRECREEAGVDVTATGIAGVFSHNDPDRLHFLYFCNAVGEDIDAPVTAHPHEIDEVAWVPLIDAKRVLSPHMWEKVERCMAFPGQTWPYGVGN